MKKLQILGTGCDSCEKLARMTEAAATDLQIEFTLEKVTSIEDIMQFDVAVTPALVVDGNVKVSGRLPSEEQLKAILSD